MVFNNLILGNLNQVLIQKIDMEKFISVYKKIIDGFGIGSALMLFEFLMYITSFPDLTTKFIVIFLMSIIIGWMVAIIGIALMRFGGLFSIPFAILQYLDSINGNHSIYDNLSLCTVIPTCFILTCIGIFSIMIYLTKNFGEFIDIIQQVLNNIRIWWRI